MSRLLLLNKPYGVLCQFTREAGRESLADFRVRQRERLRHALDEVAAPAELRAAKLIAVPGMSSRV